jgi:hypothetical protein
MKSQNAWEPWLPGVQLTEFWTQKSGAERYCHTSAVLEAVCQETSQAMVSSSCRLQVTLESSHSLVSPL